MFGGWQKKKGPALSCFVQLKRVLLISFVFRIFFSERCQSTLFQIPFCRFMRFRILGRCYDIKYYIFFNNRTVPMGFLPREIRVAFPGESQLRQSRATNLQCTLGVF